MGKELSIEQHITTFKPEIEVTEEQGFAEKNLVILRPGSVSVVEDLDITLDRARMLDPDVSQEELWRLLPVVFLSSLLSTASIGELHEAIASVSKSSGIQELAVKVLYRKIPKSDDPKYYPWAVITEVHLPNSQAKILAPLNVANEHNIITDADHLSSTDKAWYVIDYMNLLMRLYDGVVFHTVPLRPGSFTHALLTNQALEGVDRDKTGEVLAQRQSVIDFELSDPDHTGRLYCYQCNGVQIAEIFDPNSNLIHGLEVIAATSSGLNFMREISARTDGQKAYAKQIIRRFTAEKVRLVI